MSLAFDPACVHATRTHNTQLRSLASISACSVIILGAYLTLEVLWSGADSTLVYVFYFAQRHPEVIGHIAGFSVTGACAQVFIFLCISSYGSFATTTITISRKFLTILLSVVIYGHTLGLLQWAGVAAVFAGLAAQLAGGSGGHAAPAAHKKTDSEVGEGEAESKTAGRRSTTVSVEDRGELSGAAATARSPARLTRRSIAPLQTQDDNNGGSSSSLSSGGEDDSARGGTAPTLMSRRRRVA